MKKLLAAWIVAVVALTGVLGAAPAAAVTRYYYPGCDTGASFDCATNLPADDNANGTTSSTPKLSMGTFTTNYNNCAAGDILLLAQGSAITTPANNSLSTTLSYLDCRSSTRASPITIGEYTPANMARCTQSGGGGTVTYTSTGMTDTSKSGVWTADLVRDCDIKVTSKVGSAVYTQRFTISTNDSSGNLTLSSYRKGNLSLVNTWQYQPANGTSYTIVGKAPLIAHTVADEWAMKFGDTGQTFDHHGTTVQGLHLEGGSFSRGVTAGSTASVLADSGLNSVGGVATNGLVGRQFWFSGGAPAACYSATINYKVASNDATSITVEGTFYTTAPRIDFTGSLTAATSGTLTAGFPGTTGTYWLSFSDGSQRSVTLTNGSTAVSWTTAVTALSVAHYVTVTCTPNTSDRYTVRGGGDAFHFSALNSDVILDGVQTSGFAIGFHCAGKVSTPTAHGFVIKNAQIKRNTMGALVSCNNVTFQANYLADNGNTLGDHHMYFSDIDHPTGLIEYQVDILNNRFTDGDMAGAGLCSGTALVMHGLHRGVRVIGNFLEETGTPLNFCWGIGIDSGSYGVREGFSDVLIEGNYLNGFPVGIGLDICKNCIIANNNVRQPNGTGIAFRDKQFQSNNTDNSGLNDREQNVWILNNTVNITAPDGNSIGIQSARNSGDSASLGGHKVANNIVLLGSSATTATMCFKTDNHVLADYATGGFVNNACYTTSASTPKWDNNATFNPLATAQSAGRDTGSTMGTDPGVAVGAAPHYPMTITTGSAAYSTGSATHGSKRSIGGKNRPQTSKGADEPNAVVVPGIATNVRTTQ